jgi:hypothetical protein
MPVKIITLEREYGSGGTLIAQSLAERLGWKLWDQEITAEIARAANIDQREAQRCDERVDPFLYRLFKVYARGSYERTLGLSDSRAFDTDCMVEMLQKVVEDVADFIRHYFGKQWPHRPLYNIMINSKFGDEFVIETILQNVAALEKHQALRGVTA